MIYYQLHVVTGWQWLPRKRWHIQLTLLLPSNRKLYMVFHICIWHWLVPKVKVMYISTVNISKMLSDMAIVTILVKYEVAYGLSINVLRLEIGRWTGLMPNNLAFFCCFSLYRIPVSKAQQLYHYFSRTSFYICRGWRNVSVERTDGRLGCYGIGWRWQVVLLNYEVSPAVDETSSWQRGAGSNKLRAFSI